MPYRSLAPLVRPRSTWLMPTGLIAMVALFVWSVAGGGSLFAAGGPISLLQATPPISVTTGKYGLGALGDTKTYSHTVTNNGVLPKTITLAVTSYKGWTVSVFPASMNLGGGVSATAVV